MPISMNTKELFNPSNWMSKELRESKDQGLLRIEISYIADDELAEQLFFKIDFEAQAKLDINKVKDILNGNNKLCFHLSLKELLDTFQFEAKQRQLFVLQPDMCAMIYTKNIKNSNYTGFLYDIPARTRFNYQDFLLKYALPGPGSKIHCILQPKGMEGDTIDLWLQKDYEFSHIPGFIYERRSVSDLPKPSGWTKKPLNEEQLKGLQLKEIEVTQPKPQIIDLT